MIKYFCRPLAICCKICNYLVCITFSLDRYRRFCVITYACDCMQYAGVRRANSWWSDARMAVSHSWTCSSSPSETRRTRSSHRSIPTVFRALSYSNFFVGRNRIDLRWYLYCIIFYYKEWTTVMITSLVIVIFYITTTNGSGYITNDN